VHPCDEHDFFFFVFPCMEHRWNEIDRGKPKYLGKTLSCGLTRDRTQASVLRGWRLTAWAMAGPVKRSCSIKVTVMWKHTYDNRDFITAHTTYSTQKIMQSHYFCECVVCHFYRFLTPEFYLLRFLKGNIYKSNADVRKTERKYWDMDSTSMQVTLHLVMWNLQNKRNTCITKGCDHF
jgi:hypothetical protein